MSTVYYYTYDKSHRLTGQVNAGTEAQVKTYSYNERNMVTQIVDNTGTDTTRYFAYNGLGERVYGIDGTATPSYWCYDGGKLVYERQAANVWNYRHSPAVPGGRGTLNELRTNDGSTASPDFDGFANMKHLNDVSGSQIDSYEQTRFGQRIAAEDLLGNRLQTLTKTRLMRINMTSDEFFGVAMGLVYSSRLALPLTSPTIATSFGLWRLRFLGDNAEKQRELDKKMKDWLKEEGREQRGLSRTPTLPSQDPRDYEPDDGSGGSGSAPPAKYCEPKSISILHSPGGSIGAPKSVTDALQGHPLGDLSFALSPGEHSDLFAFVVRVRLMPGSDWTACRYEQWLKGYRVSGVPSETTHIGTPGAAVPSTPAPGFIRTPHVDPQGEGYDLDQDQSSGSAYPTTKTTSLRWVQDGYDGFPQVSWVDAPSCPGYTSDLFVKQSLDFKIVASGSSGDRITHKFNILWYADRASYDRKVFTRFTDDAELTGKFEPHGSE